MSVRSTKFAATSLVLKPVASGSGVTCSILLAEPSIFLLGFNHDGHGHCEGQSGTTLLRGKLQLLVSKDIKIKAVQLKLVGRARTEWPEGMKLGYYEEENLRTQVLTFFDAMNNGWKSDYGNQCAYRLKSTSPNGISLATRPNPPKPVSPHYHGSMTTRKMKRLSPQSIQSRSFNKDSPIATATQVKGYKVFYPGTYDYFFELPIDHRQLETTKVQYGSVKWELHATVDRPGVFNPNLHGMKEVSIPAMPGSAVLQHHRLGKSFPIGSKIPITFKLMPLAKVQVHGLKVFVAESIEYWSNDRRFTRKASVRKILLLNKTAGKPLDPSWASSDLRTVRGGELTPEQRREARETAARQRTAEASRRHTAAQPLPKPSDNLLGDLDLGLESLWGLTEIEADVQIPTCEMMAKNQDLRLHPDCSWKNVNVQHLIKVMMGIGCLDPDDSTGKKRRHFEIGINLPFTVLNCQATQANTSLPAYSGEMCQSTTYQSACGCPDASTIPTEPSLHTSIGTLAGVNVTRENRPSAETAAVLGPRPIHLSRLPIFNSPAFGDNIAPPPAPELVDEAPETGAMAPPPQYDDVVGNPSVDGLADYFSRLADYFSDDPVSDNWLHRDH
ncbi:hypothetical protein MRS44_013956 [Fusarium solani]|uniref:uncharacterized protein n=1 Tax=Fusarium solani TaxID=169388 RepID=UPI0032C458EF|nr:hypothetical protein MRS44_013956 [Fusarium solani]